MTISFARATCALVAIALGSSCSSAPKAPPGHPQPSAPQQGVPEVMGPLEPYGPPMPGTPGGRTEEPPANTYGPEPISLRPVVLVLGPGMIRGYAYVGAIRALAENKISVAAVLGTEMGAVVGGIYAMERKVNHLDWALQRLKPGAFDKGGGLLPSVFQKSGRTKELETELGQAFGKKDLTQSAIPLRVGIAIDDGRELQVLDRGPAAGAMRAAMADPELYDPARWNGSVARSAAKLRPFLVPEARALNLGPVIVISAMDPAEERQTVSGSELNDADLVIRPDLGGIGALDFAKRTEAAFRGKKAVESRLPEIRQLVGLPREGDPRKEATK